jgi:vancomycin permeability regulator SanA
MRWYWIRRAIALVAILAFGLIAGSQLWIRGAAAGKVYAEADVPKRPVALVLGAMVHPDGTLSAFLEARVAQAKRLYDAGKVEAILVSGDHGEWAYDEPGRMHAWHVEHGVPDAKVVDDYAGFDTYDSCQRAVRVFGVQQAIVVTQSYHIERAVALCRHLGVDATGIGDDTVRIYRQPWLSSAARENGAVVKALFDVVSGRDPIFLGRHETTVDDALRLG